VVKIKYIKAAGDDGSVSNYVIGSLKGVKRPLLNICRSLEESVIPEEWRRGNETNSNCTEDIVHFFKVFI